MANRHRPRPQETDEFPLSHFKLISQHAGTVSRTGAAKTELIKAGTTQTHPAVGEPPEPPPTRLDIRDALVKKKGGGFSVQRKGWFNNSDESGQFQRRPYNKGLSFIIGFQCSWLELERIEDFVVKALFTETGRDLPGTLFTPENIFYCTSDIQEFTLHVSFTRR